MTLGKSLPVFSICPDSDSAYVRSGCDDPVFSGRRAPAGSDPGRGARRPPVASPSGLLSVSKRGQTPGTEAA